MKYKVGDRVKIREILNTDMPYVVREMLKWAGKTMQIRSVGDYDYKMKEDESDHFGEGWHWNEEMIECKVEDDEQTEKEKFWGDQAKDLSDAVFLPLMKESMKPRAKYNFPTNQDALKQDAQFDKIAKPRHYNLGKVECIDAIESALIGYTGFTAYCVGNCIKYLHRSPHKGTQDDDMAKAKWYLDKAIESLKESK